MMSLKPVTYALSLSYDAFPRALGEVASSVGNITTYIKSDNWRLSIAIGIDRRLRARFKEPTDLTEVTIQVTGALNRQKVRLFPCS